MISKIISIAFFLSVSLALSTVSTLPPSPFQSPSSPLTPPYLPSLWLKVHRPFQKRLYGLNQSQDHQTVFGECFKYKPAEDVVVHWYSCAKNTLNLRIKTEPVPGQAQILDRDSDYFWDSAAHRTADY